MLEHFTTGSQQPPKTKGLLRLYSMEYCPFAQRTRLVLKAKNIPHEIVNIDLINKPEWYFQIHPEGKVPALDTDSEVVLESLAISNFLDEKYQDLPLYSKNLEAKSRDQQLIRKIDPLVGLFYQCVLGLVQKSPEEWAKTFASSLEEFESELSKRGGIFFAGDKPGMVDYMLWPWGQRADAISLALGQKLPLDLEEFPFLRKWAKNMRQDVACQETYTETAEYWNFIQQSL